MFDLWPLVAWGAVYVIAGGLLGAATAWIFRVPREHRSLFTVASAFSNVGSLPMVLLQTLCFTERLSGEQDCFTRATAFIFLPTILSSVLFWSVGDAVLAAAAPGHDAAAADGAGLAARLKRILHGLLNPAMIFTFAGLFVALVPGLQQLLFGGGGDPALGFLSNLLDLLGQPTNALTQILLGASVGRSVARLPWAKVRRALAARCCCCCGAVAKRRGWLPAGGEYAPAALTESGEKTNGREDDANDDDENVLLAAESTEAAAAARGAEPMSPRTVVLLSIGRGVVFPLLLFGLVVLALEPHVQGPNAPLARLVMFTQALAPTANMVVVLGVKRGVGPAVDSLALSICLQLVCLVPVLVFGIAVALSRSYPTAA